VARVFLLRHKERYESQAAQAFVRVAQNYDETADEDVPANPTRRAKPTRSDAPVTPAGARSRS